MRAKRAAKATAGVTATACSTLLCAAGLLAAPGGAGAAHADQPRTLAQVRTEVAALYRRAEAATDAYNAATEKVLAQQKDLVALAIAIDRARTKLGSLTEEAGALARAQYRSGGLTDGMRLALSADPENPGSFLDAASLAARGAHAASTTISELKTTKSELDAYAHAATTEWENLVQQQSKASDAKQEIENRLGRAEALLAALQAQERARLGRLEDEAAFQSQLRWQRTDAGTHLSSLPGSRSDQGRRAVAFAAAQIGKPYAWGADGPFTFDCSGLTEQAWAAAGRSIPRTSQEQWERLRRVPLTEMRPGDLIIYFSDASHVALYVGDGAIIHAPRPGRTVGMAGAGSMPILGVVRPG